MMLPTHALGGMALALPVVLLAPEFAGPALAAGLLGGIFPDLDMYVGHRKSLHYPVYYSALAVPTVALAVITPSAAVVAVALFLLGASLHCVSDVFGGGLELRPWEATSDRGVYDHYRGTWIAPKRWVRYDGSPGDLLLSGTLAAPLVLVVEGPLYWTVVAALTVAVVYTGLRRVLPTIATILVTTASTSLPASLLARVPDRYLEDLQHPQEIQEPQVRVSPDQDAAGGSD